MGGMIIGWEEERKKGLVRDLGMRLIDVGWVFRRT